MPILAARKICLFAGFLFAAACAATGPAAVTPVPPTTTGLPPTLLTPSNVTPTVVVPATPACAPSAYPPPPTAYPALPPTALAPAATAIAADAPYYDRTYRLDNTCNEATCLFSDTIGPAHYLIGYAVIWGHYISLQRAWQGHDDTCDGFVIDSAPPELLDAYLRLYSGDTATLTQTVDGKLVINIPLWNEDEATKAVIHASSSESPVALRALNEPPNFRGIESCFSPISILRAIKPFNQSDFNQATVISEVDNGRTFTYTVATRFQVSLDNTKHPRPLLTCVPAPIYGYISNGSNSDGRRYPVQYETVRTGECQLTNGDFHVKVVVLPNR